MAILEYKLIQQTPMIHFQSGEEGATLRAGEVKPKLDRFLLKQLGGTEVVREEHPSWFVCGEHDALNYKLRFKAKTPPQCLDEPHKLYFGNMGATAANKKKTVFYPKGISMNVVCFVDDLRREIERLLPYYFALHAFGTRSGKGFGCFSVENCELDPKVLENCCPLNTYYTIIYPNKQQAASLLSDIWVISGMMKSGFNFTFRYPNDYYKGHIFRYFTEKEIGGDKAFIKQKVLPGRNLDTSAKSEEKINYTEFRFVRALLGLPGGFEFRSGKNTTRRGKVDVKSDTIERFQSPVFYRVQNNQLLIIPQRIPDEILNAAFYLNREKICAPEKFDLIDFLDSFVERFNARTDISDFQSPEVKKSLITNENLIIRKIGGMPQ